VANLGKAQERFSQRIAVLELAAKVLGYEIRGGDYFRDERVHGKWGIKKGYGRAYSCHKLKLAKDLNLTKDGVYLEGDAATIAHNELHDVWDLLGGSKRIKNDLNHYSDGWGRHR
jgi:hypothetical protein